MSELEEARARLSADTDKLDRLLDLRARLSPFPRDQVTYQSNPGSDRVCLVPAEGVGTPPRPSGKVIPFPRRLRVIDGGA